MIEQELESMRAELASIALWDRLYLETSKPDELSRLRLSRAVSGCLKS